MQWSVWGFEGTKRRKRKISKRKVSRKPGASTEISGDYGEKVPPVPIPNTEVKLLRVESTWLVTAREDSSSPDSMKSLSCKTTGFSLRFWGKEGGGTGGNPSVRCGGQLSLHRGAEDNTPQFAVGDQLSPYTGESRGILSDL